MGQYYDVFHKLERGILKNSTREEWEASESAFSPTVIDSRVGGYSVTTLFISHEPLYSGASQRSRPFRISVSSSDHEFTLPQSDFPHRVVYDRIESMEDAKLVHFSVVRVLEHVTGQKAESWMARRAVHNTYWDPEDESEPSDRDCRVVNDRSATDCEEGNHG